MRERGYDAAVRWIRKLVLAGRTGAAARLTATVFPETRVSRVARSRSRSDGARCVHVFDPHLGPLRGHHLNFNQSIHLDVRGRRGVDCLFHGRVDLAPQIRAALPVRAFFVRGARWRSEPGATHRADPEAPGGPSAPPDPKRVARKLRQSRAWNDFYARQLADVTRAAIDESDVVVFHSILRSSAASIARWLRAWPAGRGPTVVVAIMFGDYADDTGDGLREEYRELVEALGAHPPQRRFVVAETGELRDDLRTRAAHSGTPVDFEIEIAPHFKPEATLDARIEARARRHAGAPRAPVRVGYVGHNRPDRGSHLVPEVIERVLGACRPKPGAVVHFADPDSQPAESQRLRANTDVRFIGGGLSSDDYYQLLMDLDVVLFPYEPGPRTELRGSGIFWESLALGQVMVVPEGSAFHRELERVGSGCATYTSWDPVSIAEAAVTAVSRYDELAPFASAGGAKWLADHRLSSFMDRVLAA